MGLKSEFNRPTIADELCAVVECLLTARYSEAEIVDYLEGPFGASPEAAARAVSLVASSTPSTGVRAER